MYCARFSKNLPLYSTLFNAIAGADSQHRDLLEARGSLEHVDFWRHLWLFKIWQKGGSRAESILQSSVEFGPAEHSEYYKMNKTTYGRLAPQFSILEVLQLWLKLRKKTSDGFLQVDLTPESCAGGWLFSWKESRDLGVPGRANLGVWSGWLEKNFGVASCNGVWMAKIQFYSVLLGCESSQPLFRFQFFSCNAARAQTPLFTSIYSD